MNILRSIKHLKRFDEGVVLTIGNFDGIHVGHQAVLDAVVDKAGAANMQAAVMTFDPHPREFFQAPKKVPSRLTRFREKVSLIAKGGVSHCICLSFNAPLAAMPAEKFVKTVLVDTLNMRSIIVGDDFRFGHERLGDFALLEKMGKKHGFSVLNAPTLDYQGRRVSSTRVREALEKGDFSLARALLGRDYSMQGRVAHGDKRGRIIGFPTANIFLHREISPLKGVYVVKCYGVGDSPCLGVANIGVRPTVGGKGSVLEVHLFDFHRDIYGCHLTVEFLHKIRDEKKFDSFEALKAQISRDVNTAQDFFKKDNGHSND